MTIKLLNQANNSEFSNAHALIKLLESSEPRLHEPSIRLELLASVHILRKQLDFVLIFEDNRSEEQRFKTATGQRVQPGVKARPWSEKIKPRKRDCAEPRPAVLALLKGAPLFIWLCTLSHNSGLMSGSCSPGKV